MPDLGALVDLELGLALLPLQFFAPLVAHLGDLFSIITHRTVSSSALISSREETSLFAIIGAT